MLLTVALSLCLHSPQESKAWVDEGQDPTWPSAFTVAGTTELTAGEAWSSVRQRADEDRRDRLRGLAARQAEEGSSWWLPGWFKGRVVEEWTMAQVQRQKPRVLDRELRVRDHDGIGRSYQAFLLLEDVDTAPAIRSRTLARRLEREERRMLTKCGGTVGWWGLLALVLGWIDRLTRGYMTGRLWCIGGLLGLGVPIPLVLL